MDALGSDAVIKPVLVPRADADPDDVLELLEPIKMQVRDFSVLERQQCMYVHSCSS